MLPKFIEARIENTNACGYRCFMCPREKQTRKIGFMSVEDFSLVLSKLPDSIKSMHLHGYGEPLLDPSLIEKIKLTSKKNIETTIFSTLGLELSDETITSLASSGLNKLRVSLYGFDEMSYKKIHGTNKLDLVKKNLKTLKKALEKTKSPLTVVLQITPEKEMLRLGTKTEIVQTFMQELMDLGFAFGATEDWHNYGDGRNFQPPSEKVCPVIAGKRKQILQVTYKLEVIPCCFDYDATIKLGNLKEQSLEEIFSSPVYEKFVIAQLFNEFSNHAVCKGCEKFDI